MKRFLLVVLGVVVLMMALSPVLVANDENFDRAGQKLLAESDKLLAQKEAEIEEFLDQAAEDGIITRNEMLSLRNLLRSFRKTKSDLDERLKFYDLATTVSPEEELFQATNSYFEHGVRKRDSSQLLRQYFARRTGEDVLVEGGLVLDRSLIVPIVFLCLFALLFVAGLYGDESMDMLGVLGLVGMVAVTVLIFVL